MRRTGGGPSVRLEGVTAGYRRGWRTTSVLTDVSLHLPPGGVTAVLGLNGAGKTTLFRLLLGFITPRRGRVRIDDLPPGHHRKRFGTAYLPESARIPEGWPLSEFLARGARLAGLRGTAAEGALLRARARAGFGPDSLELTGSRLSKGMVRRGALAFALIGEPGLVLLDEPTGGLDLPARRTLREMVRNARLEGATVLLATHELEEAARMAQRALVVADGEIETLPEGPGELTSAVLARRLERCRTRSGGRP